MLEVGDHRAFRAVFELPADAPPTSASARVKLAYAVEVVVEIPWWPSARVVVELVVTPELRARPEPAPVLATSPPIGGPRLELTLDDRAFSPGERLAGSFALSPGESPGPHEVRVALVGYEHVGDKTEESLSLRDHRRARGRDRARGAVSPSDPAASHAVVRVARNEARLAARAARGSR